MSTAQSALTVEQKIELAAAEAAQVASVVSPAIGAAIQGGVAVEPVVSGFVKMLIGIFKHHVTTPAPVVQSKSQAESLAAAIAKARG